LVISVYWSLRSGQQFFSGFEERGSAVAFETLAVSEDTGRKSLADVAYESIRDRLLMLDIKPGELLNDDALAKALGVGRTPIREALKRLELDRLVVTYPRRGTFATRVDVTDLSYISEIRAQLEPLAAARFLHQAGIRSDAIKETGLHQLADVGDVSGVGEELHRGLNPRAAVARRLAARHSWVHDRACPC